MATALEADWVAMRREWEHTDISLGKLALRWGFKSDGSIRRRAEREGWSRNLMAIAAELAAKALLPDPQNDDGEGVRGVRGVRGLAPHTPHTRTHEPAPNPATAGDTQRGVRGDGLKTPEYAVSGAGETTAMREAVEDLVMPPTTDLATELARSKRMTLHVSRRGIAVALEWIEQLHTLGTAELGSVEHSEAVARTQAMNNERDTLATVMKSTVGMMEVFVKMERLALGLDIAGSRGKDDPGLPGPVSPSAGPVTPAMMALFALLPEQVMMSLREATVKLNRMGPGNATRPFVAGIIDGTIE